MTPPELVLSLQQPDGRHRQVLTRSRVARWLRAALGDTPAQVTLRIVDADEGRALNRDFRGKDYATDVLTFGYERTPVVVADLVLCAPVVEAEAKRLRLPLEAHYAHLVVHGALHALGHDHEDDADAAAMQARETQVLRGLRLHDPYAGA